jgi:asparagine synthase (glutamine-hydrolysing)
MCGICGILLFDARAEVDSHLLMQMNRTMMHRGPDDEGYYASGPVGLGMRRLSIIDLDGGRQPISNENDTLRIVYNGEIYNYQELHADLITRGHLFKTQTDTEVILHLYEELGEECVTRLRGMFAFAIWDEKKHRLFMARDRLGIKPLFYAHEPGKRIVFGSEIKAILPAGISREPNYQGVYDYLSHMYVPTPETAYAAVKKLPPASWLSCSADTMEIRQYWDIPLPPEGYENDAGEAQEEELLDKLQDAIRSHMIADVTVGALLSGGLDSTTVTAVMSRKLNIPVKTFTVGFDRKSYDESPEARLVARTLGTDHIEEVVHPGMIESIPELLDSFDEPFADYSAIPTYLVSRIAAQHVKVVLTGDGGDEVFAGYPTHVAYKVARLFRRIPRVIRGKLISPLVMALPTSMERISFDYKAKRFITGVDLPLGRAHYWWKVVFNEEEKRQVLNQDFLNGRPEDSYRVFDRYFRIAEKAHPLNRLLYVDARTFLLDDNLTKVDRMTMANSLEARVPLLDHELLEHVAMMPPAAKTKWLQTKVLLRQAAASLLPPAIRKGKKKGFTPPLPFWIRDEMRDFMMDCFSPARLRATGILNEHYCRSLLDEHLQGRQDNNRRIWTIVALVHWLEKNRVHLS